MVERARGASELAPFVRHLVRDVERATGRPIEIRPEPAIQGHGRAIYVVSDPDPTRHLVLYDPEHARDLDHLVAHECGHITRFVAATVEDQVLPVSTQASREAVAIRQILPELAALLRRGMPEEALSKVLPIWLRGTIAQLADIPADIRIERQLWEELPELREAQRLSLERQFTELRLVHSPPVSALTPPTIWRASDAMNVALVAATAHLFRERRLMRAWTGSNSERLGLELLALLDALPDSGLSGDRNVTDLWAKRLGLDGWLEWRRLDALPAGFRHAWE